MPDHEGHAIDPQRVIGPPQPDDWRLDPLRDAAALPAAAADLARILRDPDLADAIAGYRTADSAALHAQSRYRRLATTAAMTSFAAVLLGTATLLALPIGLPPAVLSMATGAQALLVVVSLMAALVNGWLRPFEAWQSARAEAENYRIAIFNAVSTADAAPGEIPGHVLGLQLEYFRRYQLDVQRAYYQRRSRSHARSAARARAWRVVALLLVVAGGASLLWSLRGQSWLPEAFRGILGALPDRGELGQRLFLALGIWASALQNLLSSLALITLDERNAARYSVTAENLETLAGRTLDEVRAAVASADGVVARVAVTNFVGLVHDQISSEHREWIALRKVAPELSLRQLSLRRQPAPAMPVQSGASRGRPD
ncbi:MAG: hypothetical protein ACOYLQ_20440 [Hyphomicrobiaceae bacterium]